MITGDPAMPSVRLTTDIRSRVAGEILKHRFAGEIGKLLDDRAALAKAVYDDLYRTKDRKIIEGLPKGWLREDHTIKAQFGASVDEIPFDGHHYRIARLGVQISR